MGGAPGGGSGGSWESLLVVGGRWVSEEWAACEVYDPATRTWAKRLCYVGPYTASFVGLGGMFSLNASLVVGGRLLVKWGDKTTALPHEDAGGGGGVDGVLAAVRQLESPVWPHALVAARSGCFYLNNTTLGIDREAPAAAAAARGAADLSPPLVLTEAGPHAGRDLELLGRRRGYENFLLRLGSSLYMILNHTWAQAQEGWWLLVHRIRINDVLAAAAGPLELTLVTQQDWGCNTNVDTVVVKSCVALSF